MGRPRVAAPASSLHHGAPPGTMQNGTGHQASRAAQMVTARVVRMGMMMVIITNATQLAALLHGVSGVMIGFCKNLVQSGCM